MTEADRDDLVANLERWQLEQIVRRVHDALYRVDEDDMTFDGGKEWDSDTGVEVEDAFSGTKLFLNATPPEP